MTRPNPADDRPTPDRKRWLWTTSQRRTLAGLVLIGCVLLAIQGLYRPVAVPDPPASFPPHFDDLADRLDPNAATADELAVLPGIGASKAAGIVAYRNADRTFRKASDLGRVDGIGPAIVAKIAPYLVFPDEAATSRPARSGRDGR